MLENVFIGSAFDKLALDIAEKVCKSVDFLIKT